MKRTGRLTLILAVVLVCSVYAGMRHLPFFDIAGVEVTGDIPLTAGIERAVRGVEGTNRFVLSERRLEKEIEALPYIADADVSVRKGVLVIDTVGREGIILIGRTRELFTDGSEVFRLQKGDARSLSGIYLRLIIEPGRCAYMEEFGLGPEFQRVTALMLELSGGLCYNALLMDYGSYEASEGPGFGTLTLESEMLGTTFIIREDLSGEYLSELILSMWEEGPSDFRHQTYEIKDNALKMRKEG